MSGLLKTHIVGFLMRRLISRKSRCFKQLSKIAQLSFKFGVHTIDFILGNTFEPMGAATMLRRPMQLLLLLLSQAKIFSKLGRTYAQTKVKALFYSEKKLCLYCICVYGINFVQVFDVLSKFCSHQTTLKVCLLS